MKLPYDISTAVLKSIIFISEKIGEINAKHLTRQPPRLRKENRIMTSQASLGIERNTLSEQQITALLEKPLLN